MWPYLHTYSRLRPIWIHSNVSQCQSRTRFASARVREEDREGVREGRCPVPPVPYRGPFRQNGTTLSRDQTQVRRQSAGNRRFASFPLFSTMRKPSFERKPSNFKSVLFLGGGGSSGKAWPELSQISGEDFSRTRRNQKEIWEKAQPDSYAS